MDASALITSSLLECKTPVISGFDLIELRTTLKNLNVDKDSLLSELMDCEERFNAEGLVAVELQRTKGGNSRVNRYLKKLENLETNHRARLDLEAQIALATPTPTPGELMIREYIKNSPNHGFFNPEIVAKFEVEQLEINAFLSELSPWGLLKLLQPAIDAEILRREQAHHDYTPPEKQRRNRKTDIRRDRLKDTIRPVLLGLDKSINSTLNSLERSTPRPLDLFEYDIQKNLCKTRFEAENEVTEHNLDTIKALMSEINSEL